MASLRPSMRVNAGSTRSNSETNRNPPYSLGSRESLVNGGNQSDEQSISEEFATLMNVNDTRFLKDENIDGISLVQNETFVKELLIEIGFYIHGRKTSFALFTTLPQMNNKKKTKELKKKPYVVGPKPLGVRHLLYANPQGRMFMQNGGKKIFELDPNCVPQLIPADTILDGVVVRKLIVRDGNQEAKGRLTFVIMNAYRCNGDNLKKKSMLERISIVQAEIIQPRLNANLTDVEVFNLDVTQYETLSHLEEYLSQGFQDSYEYPLASFIFHPLFEKLGIMEWDVNKNQERFRLEIYPENQFTGDLIEIGPSTQYEEVKYSTIKLTDELRTLDGCIIECRLVEHR